MSPKKNIFEHICYEINEYLITYDLIIIHSNSKNDENNPNKLPLYIYNCVWDSHFIHMRNLKDFFMNKPQNDDIVLQTVLDFDQCNYDICKIKLDKTKLNINDENGKPIINKETNRNLTYITVINKSVEHLTESRVQMNTCPLKTLDELQKLTVIKMMEMLYPRIKIFLSLLCDSNNVVLKYRNDLEKYQKKLISIRNDLLLYMSKTYNLP